MSSEVFALVQSRVDFEFPRLRAAAGAKVPARRGIPLTDSHWLLFVERVGGRLSEAVLAELDHARALELAYAMAGKLTATFVQESVVWRCAPEDGLAAARLLAVDAIERLPLKGSPVAVTPTAGVIAIAGSKDTAGLRALAEVAALAFESNRPLSVMPLVLEARRWRSFTFEQDHPAFDAWDELIMRERHTLYAAQKELLEQFDERYITPFECGQDKTGRYTSFCTWTGVVDDNAVSSDVLLPITDKVCLVRVEDQRPIRLTGMVPRNELERVCSGLLERTDDYPPRLRVLGFPTQEQVARLAAIAPPSR